MLKEKGLEFFMIKFNEAKGTRLACFSGNHLFLVDLARNYTDKEIEIKKFEGTHYVQFLTKKKAGRKVLGVKLKEIMDQMFY